MRTTPRLGMRPEAAAPGQAGFEQDTGEKLQSGRGEQAALEVTHCWVQQGELALPLLGQSPACQRYHFFSSGA